MITIIHQNFVKSYFYVKLLLCNDFGFDLNFKIYNF